MTAEWKNIAAIVLKVCKFRVKNVSGEVQAHGHVEGNLRRRLFVILSSLYSLTFSHWLQALLRGAISQQSAVILICMAMDRYLCMLHPARYHKHSSKKVSAGNVEFERRLFEDVNSESCWKNTLWMKTRCVCFLKYVNKLYAVFF